MQKRINLTTIVILIMKRILITIISFALITFAANATDRPIEFGELPAAAQNFIKTDFQDLTVSFVTKDTELLDTTYEVNFTNGLKIEFNSKGEWREISNSLSQIESKYIPQQIQKSVSARWPEAGYKKIERDRHGYEIELTNRLELKFNNTFKLIEIDD